MKEKFSTSTASNPDYNQIHDSRNCSSYKIIKAPSTASVEIILFKMTKNVNDISEQSFCYAAEIICT